MATTLTKLVTNFNTCASSAGFNTFKFGKLPHINFDHNIKYDLLNFEYPTSRMTDITNGVQEFSCVVTAMRPTSKSNATGVEILDNVHVIMTALEARLLKFLGCVGAGSNCQDLLDNQSVQFFREKGTHNDNLVSVTCTFTINVFFDCVDFDCNNFPPATTPETYNCVRGVCVDPGDGTGTYTTLADCQTNCENAQD
ncbi:MAG: hypothetical protein Unbinned1473contig1002_46 [Prokaryotic dsDNA virus sp.]|nr:MAG: hypothetical protein Unbinned1473contig1002_46 [Prokaryotic dsDNA virus sp.]|tara:strand:- start:6743 stop:7333 length:591 start_codon:yes stop_codon:yes gene_type:complete